MVTFAIAAYNVENYISICLDSVLGQSDDLFEVLVVDDGSRDGTGRICDEYAAKDARVRVIHQSNKGISEVRNISMQQAAGDWICFVDGDDRLADGAYNRIIENVSDKFDIVYFDMQYFIYDNVFPAYNSSCDPQEISGEAVSRLRYSTLYHSKGSQNYINNCLRSVCAKVFNVGFLRENGLELEGGLKYGEDVSFKLDCLKEAKAVKLVRTPFYLYRGRADSAVHKFNPNISFRLTELAAKLRERVDDDEMLSRYYMDCIADIKMAARLDMLHKDNPKPFSEREKDFKALLLLDWCRESLENVDADRLKEKDRVFFELTKGDFNDMCRYYKKQDAFEELKRFLHKVGLIKIIKKVLKDRKN